MAKEIVGEIDIPRRGLRSRMLEEVIGQVIGPLCLEMI
jgi:hypothetical protein